MGDTRVVLVFQADNRVAVTVDSKIAMGLAEGFTSLFARRYLPVSRVEDFEGLDPESSTASVEWGLGEKFRVVEYKLGVQDFYRVEGDKPEPYKNEAPIFFMLQVLARSYAKKGLILFTDTITLRDPATKHTVLLLGYPHSGKSTVAALALSQGLEVLSTENTIARVEADGTIVVLGGTRVLVYDPRAVEKYKLNLPLKPREVTKHGYLVIDIDEAYKVEPAKINMIYNIYCSLSSSGASLEPVSGRKIVKTLWHFATAQIRGDDYYEPAPLNLSDNLIDQQIAASLQKIAKRYEGRFYEAYGAHDTVLNKILENTS